jgi:TPR repeat protein/S1-C subfamily serine protease
MKMAVNLLVVCLAVGAACLAAWSYDRSQPPKKQQLIKQTAGANQSPSLPVPLAETNDLKNLEARANNGDASAQFDLGVRCGKGDGVPVDHEKAAVWYRKAAEQGLAKAQAALGHCYAIGEGVAQDFDQAVMWFRKAAEQGDARGQSNLGFSFAKGQGVPQDYAEAVKWSRKAAEQGDARGQNNLGAAFANGQGVPQDYAEAVKWYRKAAEQGLAMAQGALGYYYARGISVPQDYAEAVKWYRKAAEQGDATAQNNLGIAFANGQGAPQNYVEAYKWCNLVLAQAKPADLLMCDGFIDAPPRVPFVNFNGTSIECGRSALVTTPIGPVKVTFVRMEKASAQILIDGEAKTKTLVQVQNSAAAKPFQAAFTLRKSLERQMTRNQIAEGQHRASVFGTKEEAGEAGSDDISPPPEIGERTMATGTGFFVTDDGYLVTCAHVVQGATYFHVRTPGGSIAAQLVRKDAALDIALLKVTGTFPAMPLARNPQAKLGDSVFTIGFPDPGSQGLNPKYTRGEISSLAGIHDDPREFQISVPVQPGNSGGALVDERGNVVGVVAEKLSVKLNGPDNLESAELPENVNYAIKGGLVYNFLNTVPELSGKLKAPHAARDLEGASAAAERAAVLVIAE